MINYLLTLIIAIIIFFAARSTIQHFTGKGGGCCGTVNTVLDKQLENPIIEQYTFLVGNMSCENCANRIKKEINKIKGASCIASYRNEKVIIQIDQPIDQQVFITIIEKLGYTIKD